MIDSMRSVELLEEKSDLCLLDGLPDVAKELKGIADWIKKAVKVLKEINHWHEYVSYNIEEHNIRIQVLVNSVLPLKDIES